MSDAATSTVNPRPELPELLTVKHVIRHILPVSAKTIYRMVETGTFPQPAVRINTKLVFWNRDEVRDWYEKPSHRKAA